MQRFSKKNKLKSKTKMENTSMNTPKKNKKKINDFVWTFVGIAALIIVLMLHFLSTYSAASFTQHCDTVHPV